MSSNAPDSFQAQLKEKSPFTQAMVSMAVFTAYADGYCAAHTRPVVKAVKAFAPYRVGTILSEYSDLLLSRGGFPLI